MGNNLTPSIRFNGFTDAWEQRKLGELGSLNRGRSKHRPRNDPKLYGGKYPFIQTGDVSKAGLFINSFQQTYSEFGIKQSKLWHKGTLLITIAANIAETSILNIDAAFPDSIIGFESNEVNIVFIKNIIDKTSEDLKRKAETSSQSNLNLSKLSELKILLPNYEEQSKIGNFFKQLDDTIALHQRELDLLKEQKKGFLQKMFPKKDETIPEIRFEGFTDAWEQRKLGEVADLITKGTTPKDKSWSGPVNYVKTESINPDSGKISVKAKTSIEEHEGYLKRSQLKENDILFSIVGTLGRVGVVKCSDLPANTNQQIAIIRLSNCDVNFVFYYLKTSAIASFILSDSTVGAQPSLSLWQVNDIGLKFPSPSEQTKIGNFFKQLDDTIALHQRKVELLKELKKGYLQNMFV